MVDAFFPHRAKIYRMKVVKKGLQEVQEPTLVESYQKCKVVSKKAKWVNGVYVMETSTDTSIIFPDDACILNGDNIVVGEYRYSISDIQPRVFSSGHKGGKRATCNTL